MGMCSSFEMCRAGDGSDFKDEFALEFAAVRNNGKPTYNHELDGENGGKISQDFLTKLPSSKVLLVSSKSRRSQDGLEEAQEVQGLRYDLPDDFAVPPELCLNQEEGLKLVSKLSNQ